jgi:hypothetical protein
MAVQAMEDADMDQIFVPRHDFPGTGQKNCRNLPCFFVQEERPRKSHWNYQKVDMSHFSAKKVPATLNES